MLLLFLTIFFFNLSASLENIELAQRNSLTGQELLDRESILYKFYTLPYKSIEICVAIAESKSYDSKFKKQLISRVVLNFFLQKYGASFLLKEQELSFFLQNAKAHLRNFKNIRELFSDDSTWDSCLQISAYLNTEKLFGISGFKRNGMSTINYVKLLQLFVNACENEGYINYYSLAESPNFDSILDKAYTYYIKQFEPTPDSFELFKEELLAFLPWESSFKNKVLQSFSYQVLRKKHSTKRLVCFICKKSLQQKGWVICMCKGVFHADCLAHFENCPACNLPYELEE